MRSPFSVKSLFLLLLFSSFVWLSSFHGCEAKRVRYWKKKKISNGGSSGGRRHSSPPSPARPLLSSLAADDSTTFNVLNYGAKGDGVADDTEAFQSAWDAACKVEASTMVVPAEHEFLVRPVSFSGPYCQPNIVFQLDGTILAPTSASAWGSGLLQWLEFTKLKGLTVQGQGVIDGRGAAWWGGTQSYDPVINAMLHSEMPSTKPTALRFYGSTNVTVTGITIRNSPQCHLKFDSCTAVSVYNMTISSPGDSLNTDGIHLQNSVDVSVHHTNLACGDDCISIQSGCSNIRIHNINCGPGHGISIGGLGRDNTRACVSNVTVRDIVLQGTLTGVRIKTWQGGSGYVQGVLFSNIQVSEVQSPIVIDQFYCDRGSCRNQSSAVALSGITYERVQGTYTVKPVHLACSDGVPCTDVILNTVSLQPVQESYHMYNPFCWQAFGQLETPAQPPVDCLLAGRPAKHIQVDTDSC
ncbi:polygalacturonase At1g48100-like [Nymphaea colorata]|nr:polygalacturonase At1g48100-like [Nymphaea colorata]